MKIPSETVAQIVSEASEKMSDPNYSAVVVGGFVQSQPAVAQYISSYEQEIGGATGVVHAIFHAALLSQCFYRTLQRDVPCLQFEDLNHVSNGDKQQKLKQQQPALLTYIDANVEDKTIRDILILVALAMEWIS